LHTYSGISISLLKFLYFLEAALFWGDRILKPSVSNETAKREDIYIAPDPRFISTLMVFAKGFPWGKFLQFFREKELVSYSAEDQIFLLRLLAVQEMLCLDDEALLKWVKHQFQLSNFLHIGYKPKVPSLEQLVEFRTVIDAVGILSSFRKQCQKLIIMHGENLSVDLKQKALLSDSSSRWGSQRVIGLKNEDAEQNSESKWISCPICESQNINKVLPPHWAGAQDGDWCRCRFCGNKFKL